MMKKNLLILAPFLSVVLSACSFSLAADVTPPPNLRPMAAEQTQVSPVSGPLYPFVPPDPGEGAAIYPEKCAPCHGETGQGDGPRAGQLPNPVPALGSPQVARESTPQEWYQIVTEGNLERMMPPFVSLSDPQRWDLVAYAFSLSTTPESLAQGKELYLQYCAECHGEEGKGDGSQAASLSVPPTNFTDQQWMAQKSTANFAQAIREGAGEAMPAFSGQLDDNQIWALADAVRAFSFVPSGDNLAVQVTLPPEETPQPEAATQPDFQNTPVALLDSGMVKGTVTNTSGGDIPVGSPVTLHGYDDMQAVVTQTVNLNPDGTYVFDGVDMPQGRAFLTTIGYQGTTYGSDIAVADSGPEELNLPIQVYDTTTDPSVLSVDRLHVFFDFLDEKTVQVIQLYIISNGSNKTLVPSGQGGTTVNFELPSGASNLEIQDGAIGQRYAKTESGFADTIPIHPGTGNYQVVYTFTMPYKGELDLVQPISLPTDAVVLLVPESGVSLKGANLQDAGTRDIQGTQYHMYNHPGMAAGDELHLTLSGSGSTMPSLSGGSSSSLLVGIAAFGIVLLVAGIWLFNRSRTHQITDGGVDLSDYAPPEASQESAEMLMDSILALDDLYQAGQLPEEAYRQRRAELKERLKQVTSKSQGGA